ncbi:hypothetical protein DL98DRAFT_593392 [Cadophora sp. DSE1049]|nr:hypothetical protein DL98DRAFT_593392 [Cadophora sp. DSE1049]
MNLLHKGILQLKNSKADGYWREKKAHAAKDGIDLNTTSDLTKDNLMSPEPAMSRERDDWENEWDSEAEDVVDEETIVAQITDGSFGLSFNRDEDVALINSGMLFIYPHKAKEVKEQTRLLEDAKQRHFSRPSEPQAGADMEMNIGQENME